MHRMKVAILGASGLVGQRFLQKLDRHPYFEVELITGNESIGKSVQDVWALDCELPERYGDVRFEKLDLDRILKSDIKTIFSSIPTDTPELKEYCKSVEVELAMAGKQVFSNASPMRMDSNIPLIIPEVNEKDLSVVKTQPWNESGGALIKNPNCSTVGLALLLALIKQKYGLKEVNVVTMQAVSGAGLKAYPGSSMSRNLSQYIKDEEAKIKSESRKILNSKFDLSAKCFRVDVRDGHTEYVQIKTVEKPAGELKNALRNFDPLKEYGLPSSPKKLVYLFEDPGRPRPVQDVNNGGGMSLNIGGIRKGNSYDIECTILTHNTIRGAAGASILNAELFYYLYRSL